MVVAPAVAQLLFVVTDPRADDRRVAEIKGRSRHRSRRLGKRNGIGINREKTVGQDRQPVIENARAGCCALQIEEAVVGLIDDRGAVGAAAKLIESSDAAVRR